MKKVTLLTAILMMFLMSCEPKQGTKEDKEAVKQDTINPREGEGEGDVGEGVYGN